MPPQPPRLVRTAAAGPSEAAGLLGGGQTLIPITLAFPSAKERLRERGVQDGENSVKNEGGLLAGAIPGEGQCQQLELPAAATV